MHLWAGRTWPACMNYHKKACKDSTWAVLIRHVRRRRNRISKNQNNAMLIIANGIIGILYVHYPGIA